MTDPWDCLVYLPIHEWLTFYGKYTIQEDPMGLEIGLYTIWFGGHFSGKKNAKSSLAGKCPKGVV